jgi:hypothetical protein
MKKLVRLLTDEKLAVGNLQFAVFSSSEAKITLKLAEAWRQFAVRRQETKITV